MQKKLIYIANYRIPTEKAHGMPVMKMCEAFAEAGLDVLLVLPRRLNHIKQDPFDYYNIKKTFKISKLPTLDFIALGLGKFGFFVETFIFLIVSKIYFLFKNYDILYTREPLAGLFFKNIVLEIHSLPSKGTHSINFLFKKICGNARALLALTSFIKNELIKHKIPEDKILILSDAVDLAKFDITISKEEARNKLNLPQEKAILGYVGKYKTMGEGKGVDDIIVACGNLFNQGMNIFFLFVGLNEYEISEVKMVCKKSKLITGHYLLVPHVPQRELPLYLKAADALIMNYPNTEHYARYMSPLKLFEYMASGRPIVTSDLPSLREILSEKEAVFFKPDDLADLALKTKELLANPILAEQLASNALQKVQNYTWKKRAKQAFDFIG